MERVEHVEVIVTMDEIKKVLGLPAAATVVALASPDVNVNHALAQGLGGQNNVADRTQDGTTKLRFRFTRDQEAK